MVRNLDVDEGDLSAAIAAARLRGKDAVAFELAEEDAVLALFHDLKRRMEINLTD